MILHSILKNESIYRASFHEWWTSVQYRRNCAVLDIGGCKTPATEYSILANQGGFEGAIKVNNISHQVGADYVCDAAELPIPDNQFDEVWAFNVLEHVENPQKVINEIYRVLKSNGSAYGVMPFIHAIHGEPYDYWRMSNKALETVFRSAGFKTIKITSLDVGPFVMSSALIQFYLPSLLFVFLYGIAILLDRLILSVRPQYLGRWPLGYSWIITK